MKDKSNISIAEKVGFTSEELEILRDALKSVPAVEDAILYGSRAKGCFRPFSDVDLTLTGDGLTLDDMYDLADRLYESSLPYMFDLSIYSKLRNQALIDHIDRRGILIFSR